MPDQHEISAIRQENGLVAIISGLGNACTTSIRMSKEEALRLSEELEKASRSKLKENKTHHIDYTEKDAGEMVKAALEPQDEAILKEIKPKRKLAEGTSEIKEAENPNEGIRERARKGRPPTKCHVCKKKLGQRVFRNKEGYATCRGCRNKGG